VEAGKVMEPGVGYLGGVLGPFSGFWEESLAHGRRSGA